MHETEAHPTRFPRANSPRDAYWTGLLVGLFVGIFGVLMVLA